MRSGVGEPTSTASAAQPNVDSEVRGIPSHRSPTEVDNEMVTGEVDLDNFEDFEDNSDCLDGVEKMDECFDIPGHEEWTEEPTGNDFSDDSATSYNAGYRTSYSENSHLHSHSHLKMESVAPKSKLSLRQQKSEKLRVCEMVSDSREMQCVKNPPIASVKPIQLQARGEQTSSYTDVLTEAELYEEPVLVGKVSEVEGNSWKMQPFLKLKVYNIQNLCLCVDPLPVTVLQAHFVRVCEMLDHSSGSWKVTVMIADVHGSQLRVLLSNKVALYN